MREREKNLEDVLGTIHKVWHEAQWRGVTKEGQRRQGLKGNKREFKWLFKSATYFVDDPLDHLWLVCLCVLFKYSNKG